MRRREEENILRRALNLEVEGGRPPGRPNKTWRKVVEEDMRMLNITEEMGMDRQQWKRLIIQSSPIIGSKWTLNDDDDACPRYVYS